MLNNVMLNFVGSQTYKVTTPADMSEFAANYLLNNAQQLHMVDQLMFKFGGRENLARVRDIGTHVLHQSVYTHFSLIYL